MDSRSLFSAAFHGVSSALAEVRDFLTYMALCGAIVGLAVAFGGPS